MTTNKKINAIRTMLSRALQELSEMQDDTQRPQAVYRTGVRSLGRRSAPAFTPGVKHGRPGSGMVIE